METRQFGNNPTKKTGQPPPSFFPSLAFHILSLLRFRSAALYVPFPKSRSDLKGTGVVIGGESASDWSVGIWGRGRHHPPISGGRSEGLFLLFSQRSLPEIWLPRFLRTILRNCWGGDERRRKERMRSCRRTGSRRRAGAGSVTLGTPCTMREREFPLASCF